MKQSALEIPDEAKFVKVTRTIYRPVAEIFQPIIAADLTRIFAPENGSPGVVSTTVSDAWGKQGMERTNTSSDGSTNNERMLEVEANRSFKYETFDFSASPMKELVKKILGGWIFVDNENGSTSIEWIYAFLPSNGSASAEIEEKLVPRYQVRLERAMSILKEELEGLATRMKS